MTSIIYTPSTSAVCVGSDCAITDPLPSSMPSAMSSAIARLQSCVGARLAQHDGAANLQSLASGGGELFIVGHFHAGQGMLNVQELLQQLLQEGLPQQPQHAISLHLYPCRQAACYHRHVEERFVIALCKAMVKLDFSNFNIFAYLSQQSRRTFYEAQQSTTVCVEYRIESGGFRQHHDEHAEGDHLTHDWTRANSNSVQMAAH